jgi:hypothetical protein
MIVDGGSTVGFRSVMAGIPHTYRKCHGTRQALIGLMLLAFSAVVLRAATNKPIFSADLRPFEYVVEKQGRMIGDYSVVTFLSENLLLVAVNQREFTKSQEPLFSDSPDATLLLFDLEHKRLLDKTQMPLEKSDHSIEAVKGDRFVALSQTGLRFCSQDLKCGSPFNTPGPVFVSAQRTRLIVGGNRLTDQELLDATTGEVLETLSGKAMSRAIPGDSGLLIIRGGVMFIRIDGTSERRLNFGGMGVMPLARFLNDDTVADFDQSKKVAIIAKTEGTTVYSVPVAKPWQGELVVSASGVRFGINEYGYTKLNSLLNPLDIDNGRPPDFQRIRVLEVGTGKLAAEFEWDPRPYVVPPALSPTGHRLAVIRQGTLEVYEIP